MVESSNGMMNHQKEKVVMDIDAIGKELARGVKTQKDISGIMGQLTKTIFESALNAELDDHLGYERNDKLGNRRKNTRNGYISKTIKCDKGELDLSTPRDRDASFEPKVIPKGKTRLEGFEDTILALYSRGMTTRVFRKQLRNSMVWQKYPIYL